MRKLNHNNKGQSGVKESLLRRIDFRIYKNGLYIFVLIGIFLIFYGMIANKIEYEIDARLIWIYQVYFELYGIPIVILLFFTFIVAYQEDISLYGLRKNLWLIPYIEFISIIWYWINFRISLEPLVLIFGRWQGYLNIFLLLTIIITGTLLGIKFKKFKLLKQTQIHTLDKNTNLNDD